MTESHAQRIRRESRAEGDVGEVVDGHVNPIKEIYKAFDGNEDLPERYLQGKLAIEVNVGIGPRDLYGGLQQYVARFQRLPGMKLIALDGADIRDWRDIHTRLHAVGMWNRGDRAKDNPVLVFVGQTGENGEGVLAWAAPSSIRLDLLNPVDGGGMEASGLSVPKIKPPVLDGRSLAMNGERVPFVGDLAIGANKRPNQMIKCGTEILDEVSGDEAEGDRRPRIHLDEHDIARLLHLYLGPVNEGFFITDVFPALAVKRAEMLHRPVELMGAAN